MDDTATLDARAQALRAEGLAYPEIGERMGESKQKAWQRCNRERTNEQTRAYKDRNREAIRAYGRAYEEANRHPCQQCGQLIGRHRTTCMACISAERDRKLRRLVRLWADGVTLPEIQAEMGWTKGHLAVEMDRARADGYDLPYRHKKRAGHKFPEQVAG